MARPSHTLSTAVASLLLAASSAFALPEDPAKQGSQSESTAASAAASLTDTTNAIKPAEPSTFNILPFRPVDEERTYERLRLAGESGQTLSGADRDFLQKAYAKRGLSHPAWLSAPPTSLPLKDPVVGPPVLEPIIPEVEDPLEALPGIMAAPEMPGDMKAKLNGIQEDARKGKDSTAKLGALSGHSGDIADAFERPKPESVPDKVWEQWRLRVTRLLNGLGTEKNNKPFTDAMRVNKPVLDADPDNRDALNNRAVSNLGLGRHTEAVADASRVVSVHTENERGYTTRALAYYQMGQYAQAREDAARALALNPNNQTAFQIEKLSAGRVTTASELGLGIQQQAAADRISGEYKAMVQQRNQVEASEAASPRLASRQPAQAGDRFTDSIRGARNDIKIGDPQSAKQSMTRVLGERPENAEALFIRAAAENLLGEYEHAAEDALAALRKDPDHAEARDALSQALNGRGRFLEAETEATRAIGMNPKNAYAYKNRARAREGLGKIDGMINDYRQAAALSPQFDSELREIARKYAIELNPARAALPASREEPPAPSPIGRRFLIILVSSVTGGLLIAMGLMHSVILPMRKRRAVSVPGAGTGTNEALANGGSLEAGFDVVKRIGEGGMGVVFEAHDKALDRKVAVKKMRDEIRLNPRERERFLQEARIVAALHHPNIVDIHGILEEAGELYMIFEFVEGRSLDQILARRKRLPIAQAVLVARGVCNALAYAHRKGVIHRDLKPSNIMITQEGLIKVMDFGIARQAKDALAAAEMTNTVAGTPLYMAPEQDQGFVRKESDIFALTACFYEMVTGARPYSAPATTANKLNKKYSKPSRLTGDLPPALDAFIDAGLEPDPDRRIPSAEEFFKRLCALSLADNVRT